MKTQMRKSLGRAFVIVAASVSASFPALSQTDTVLKADPNTSGSAGVSPRFLSETTTLFRAETTVPEIDGLDIGECVKVLNLKTDYQINLEARENEQKAQYRMDLAALRTQRIEQVLSNLLIETGDYVFVETNKTINLIPRDQQDRVAILDAVLPEYDVKQQSLIGAFEPLYRKYPQIALAFPVTVGSDSTPAQVAFMERSLLGGPPFSLKLRNASVRTILNEIASRSQNSFWIEGHSAGIPPKWAWISIFRRDYGKDVLYKHDPGLHEQFEQLMRKKMQDYEKTHPADSGQ
jgi:hypothetical protein